MKGIVFTEFLEMVEKEFGYDTVDHILTSSELPSGGVYTAVGTYSHGEIVQLVSHLSQKTAIAVPDLLRAFGQYLFNTFVANYKAFFDRADGAFDFLLSIENYIHVEVKKLYPDAELPTFNSIVRDEHTLEMNYHSDRRMADFAEGLIQKCMQYFEEDADISKEVIDDDGKHVRFIIKKTAA